LPVSGLNASAVPMPRGRLFSCRRLLQCCRRLPRTAPTLGFFPPLDQLVRNVVVAIVGGPRAVAREDPITIVQREIRRLRRLKVRLPFDLEAGLLVHTQQAGTPESGALQVVTRIAEVSGLKFPPSHLAQADSLPTDAHAPAARRHAAKGLSALRGSSGRSSSVR